MRAGRTSGAFRTWYIVAINAHVAHITLTPPYRFHFITRLVNVPMNCDTVNSCSLYLFSRYPPIYRSNSSTPGSVTSIQVLYFTIHTILHSPTTELLFVRFWVWIRADLAPKKRFRPFLGTLYDFWIYNGCGKRTHSTHSRSATSTKGAVTLQPTTIFAIVD